MLFNKGVEMQKCKENHHHQFEHYSKTQCICYYCGLIVLKTDAEEYCWDNNLLIRW
jgi:hypothetical protein